MFAQLEIVFSKLGEFTLERMRCAVDRIGALVASLDHTPTDSNLDTIHGI